MKNLFLVCLLCVGCAVAQDYPKAELYGGYSYGNIDTNGLTSRQSINGWEASVSGNFNKWFAVEADVAGYYKTYPVNLTQYGLGIVDVKVTDYSYGAGPRINIRPFFVHALLGGDHLTGSAVVSAVGYSKSQDGLAGAFGGGIEWPVSRRLAVRASADYVFTRHNIFAPQSYTQNNARAGIGLVYTFGGGAAPASQPADEKGRTRSRMPSRTAHSGMSIPALGLMAMALDTGGAEIVEVVPGSIAEQSGLRVRDVINAVDGKAVRTPMELQAELSSRASGTKIRLGLLVRGYYQSETVIILR
jgi:hypothetical protein